MTRIPLAALPPRATGRSAKGTPIRHMWACPMPAPATRGAGFPVLDHARHSTIYTATRETGAYNHHAKLTWCDGRFLAMWSNHPHG